MRKRGKARAPVLILTCEHGGNVVPAAYRRWFVGAAAALKTHRGLDIGALAVARKLAKRFKAPLVASTVTRLLVDLNRSPGHPRQFSEWSHDLPESDRHRVLAKHYWPYRDQVEDLIAKHVARGRTVVHVSVHSFTPKLFGEVRNAEIGLLYDPRRRLDARGADLMAAVLKESGTELRVRRNYPYTGVSDGFQTYLRRRFPAGRYAAIEIEMNQGVVETPSGRAVMLHALMPAIDALVRGL